MKVIEKTMLLYTSYWSNNDTFKMLPVSNDCPFVEAIYDPASTLLVVIGKEAKDNLQYLPKLDEQGDPTPVKKPRQNGKMYKEIRTNMKILQEYYIVTKEEQENFIRMFAINAETYDYGKFLRDIEEESKIVSVEKQPLVDTKGKPL